MGSSAVMIGIAHDNPVITEEEKIRFDACISRDDPTVPPRGEVQVKTIAGGGYAVFLHRASYETLGETFERIGEWIVSEGVALRDLPRFEKYLNRDPRFTPEDALRTEIYVPIEQESAV